MGTLVTHRLVRLKALVFVLVGMLWFLLARAGPVHAAGVVTNCSDDSDLIAKLAGGGLVTFNCALPAPIIITITVSGGIVTTPSTTIDGSNSGNPITLSGGNNRRLFHHIAAGSTLTLTHLTLSDGNAGSANGGCLFNEAGTAVLVDVTVTRCKVAVGHQGGGIYNGGTVTLNDSTLSGNSADKEGGAIWNSGTATLTNVTFNGNSSIFDGGGIYNGGTVTLNNSTLSGGSAGLDGGGIYNNGTATLDHSTLSGNSTLSGDGGGIYNNSFTTATLTSVTLDDNSANNGGGIYNSGIGSMVTLTNVTLNGNSAANNGGGMYNSGTATLNDSTLNGNSAANNGGGIYNQSSATLNNSTLDGNPAANDGGGIYNQSSATLNNSTLSGNSAVHGGGIYNYNTGAAMLISSTLSGNSASVGGGGIYNSDSGTATLNDSTLSGNSAANNGAGINNFGTAKLTNSTLSGNLATHWGGGIYNHFDVSLWNVTLSNNSATTGAALYIVSGYTTVLTNTILAYSPAGGNCSGTLSYSQYSISSDNSCALPAGHTIHGLNPNSLDPLLTALGNYGGPTLVHMLKLGSPAIDGVVGSDAPATDQRDLPRPGPDGSYDIGAVERQPTDSDLAPRLYLPLIER